VEELIRNARQIATRGKGILAADESTGTIGQRFAKIGVENNYENRQNYRTLLFTTPGFGQFISGVIMYEETLENKAPDGTPLLEYLKRENVLAGIKVDKGLMKIPGTQDEMAVQGLDGLAERCQKYYGMGCRFAKWRATYKIGPGLPSAVAIQENAWGLARYAAICQANGLVPIVEPEVLADGPHSISECAEKSQQVYAAVVTALHANGILFEGMLLKPNMITSGSEAAQKAGPQEIAWRTYQTLFRTMPGAVPGVMFLSGGQSEEEASVNLNAMNQLPDCKPWSLSFSYGRALQSTVLKVWGGKAENFAAAQQALLVRAEANSKAQLGQYVPPEGASAASESLFVKNYVY
jgi:fructose-bisphosphate aldolase class I